MKMERPYYDDERFNYLFPEGKKIQVGMDDCRDDFIHLAYHDFMNGGYQPAALWVIEEQGVFPDIGEWIEGFPSVKAFHVSRDLIPFKKVNLDHVRTFTLSSFCNEDLVKKAPQYSWQEAQILPNVKFFNCYDTQGIGDLGGLRSHNLPNVEWLECELDRKGKLLEVIGEFPHLTALSLDEVKNRNVFEVFQNRLKLLCLSGFSKGFPLKDIVNQTNLEIIYMNGYEQEFNLEWLLDLKLKEIQLLNCPKVINAEVLLEMNRLESLTVLACKKSLSKELKIKLKAKDFSYLDIDFT